MGFFRYLRYRVTFIVVRFAFFSALGMAGMFVIRALYGNLIPEKVKMNNQVLKAMGTGNGDIISVLKAMHVCASRVGRALPEHLNGSNIGVATQSLSACIDYELAQNRTNATDHHKEDTLWTKKQP